MLKYKNIAKIFVSIFFFVAFILNLQSTHAEIVEKLAHRDHGANGFEGAESADPPTTTIADVFPPFQVDAGQIITGINYRFNSTQDLVDALSGGAKRLARPSLTIAFSSQNLLAGESMSILAVPTGYDKLYTDQYFAWCTGTRESRISQNGLVAGGTRIPSEGNGSDCYDEVKRLPASSHDTDANNDGMGDKWEARYFGTTLVDPNADIDHDGFILDASNGIAGPNGIIRLVPNSSIIKNNTSLPFSSCDGKFPNGEEWVWGTNPLDPDTDDDGYADEQDICGRGQNAFQYTAPDNYKSGDAELVEAIAVGYSSYRSGNGSQKLAKIANVGQSLSISNGQPLQGAIEYRIIDTSQQESGQDPDTKENLDGPEQEIYVGDTVEFHAAIENSQDDEANLHYQWTFQLLDGGVDNPSKPQTVLDTVGPIPIQYAIADPTIGSAGFGLNPYRLNMGRANTTKEGTGFHIMPKTGNKVVVTVTVIEPETGKKVDITQEFPLATSILFDFSPELPVQPLFPQAEISSAPTYTVTAVVPGLDKNDFLYEWYINQEKQPNAKIGGDQATFKATKQAGEYDISVVLTRVADGKDFAEANVRAPIAPLQVSISNCNQYTLGNPQLSVGQNISMNGLITAQGNYPGELSYQWWVNGLPLTDPASAPIKQVTFVPSSIGSYEVRYEVSSVPPTEATSSPYVPVLLSDTCRISIDNNPSVAVSDRVSKLFASAIYALPGFARGMLTFLAIIFVIFVIIIRVRSQYKNKA